MQWSDRGIILSVRRLGENSGVVHVLTPDHGMHAGVDRAAFAKSRRGVYQPGNIVMAHWQARLSEQLGTLSCELTEATAAHLLDNRHKLAALHSATLLVEKMLAEREAHPEVHESLETLLHALCTDGDWLAAYVRLELNLLASSGFGLDLERCAATGQAHDLIYVSPKSGRAVSRHAGEPYREKLLRLPSFLLMSPEESSSCETPKAAAQDLAEDPVLMAFTAQKPRQGMTVKTIAMPQILDGLRLCGYFLGCRVFAPRGIPIPEARARFVKVLHTA